MIRYAITIGGRVQGVGCRFFIQHLAVRYHMTGSVKNLHSGKVYMEVQGAGPDMSGFLQEVSEGDRFIRIDELEKVQMEVKEEEKKFTIIY